MHRFRSMACYLLLLWLALVGSAIATDIQGPLPVASSDAVALLAHHVRLRDALVARKGAFKDFDAERSAALKHDLDLVIASLQGVERTTDLTPAEQRDLVNALASVQAIVNDAEDGRLICERVHRTGTRLPVTVCKTVAERREERRLAEEALRGDHQCADAANSGFCKD